MIEMKEIETDGITYIEPVPGGTAEWYFGASYEHGDLYEAEEVFKAGEEVQGRNLVIVHYPDGEVYRPVLKRAWEYSDSPVYLDGGIHILNVRFRDAVIQILRFDCETHKTEVIVELPLSAVKDCYNLRLHTAPLTLTRQGVGDKLDILWPESCSIDMEEHESFFLRNGDQLFFNKWYEEGEGKDYRYWEETVICDLRGNTVDVISGDILQMPNGALWHLK